MKKYIIALLLVSHSAFSQVLSYDEPEYVGISPNRLARVDSMLRGAVRQNEIPGAVALIVRNGKIIFHQAYGRDANGKPLNTSNIFRIASQTKAITSTAAMMLWEEGKFRLDDPISKYLPEFENTLILENFSQSDSSFTAIPSPKPITVRQLFLHTSGIGYGIIDDPKFSAIYRKNDIVELYSSESITLEENIKKLAKMPLHFIPGEKYKYGMGLDVLGRLIEVWSGMPLDQFFNQRIFRPLQMHDTYFYIPDQKKHRLVAVSNFKDGKWEKYTGSPYYNVDYPIVGAKKHFSGGAGLSSTTEDYAKFLQMYLNGGVYNGKRLLSKTTVNLIMRDQLGDKYNNANENLGLAFGIVNSQGETTGGLGSEGTFGWGGYFNTQYFADPKNQLIGILYKQTKNKNEDTGWKFKQMVFQTIEN